MKHKSSKTAVRMKAGGIAAAALAVGIGLLFLSRMAFSSAEAAATQPAATQAAQSQPAQAPATTAPADASPGTPARGPRPNPKAVNTQRLAMLLLLFGLISIGVTVVAAGWIVYDVRASRPAWMTQTKYPVRTPPKKQKK